MNLRITALTLLIAPLGVAVGCTGAHAATKPVSLAPEVIAPGNLPTLPVIRSDSGPLIVASGSFRAAPMPDDTANAPAVVAEDGQMRFRPTMFFQKNPYSGDGYAPGSDDREKAVHPATGVAVDVPLN